jgi:hypothetical protein
MSDSTTTVAERDQHGRFKPGNNGGPGRPRGARSALSEVFIADLQANWERNGPEVLERVAREEPGTYLRALVALMPKDVNLSVAMSPLEFRARFEEAVRALGNEPGEVLPRRPMKVIGNGR